MKLPRLLPERTNEPLNTDSVLLAVYAPFGTDKVLSTFPDGSSQTLAQHPLYLGLLKVAENGIHVAALVDRVGDDTWLIEIEAGKPAEVRVTSRWKQEMADPHNLAGFLRHAHQSRPTAAIVLALEGHGAGFLPEIDRTQLSLATLTENGRFEWRLDVGSGAPVLPQGAPLLPQGAPLLPVNHMPLSTWGLGAALKAALDAGVPKLSVIHFDNCFNMSVEVLHTVAPYAEYATGYPNYNFFTSGQPYPKVFESLRQQGTASAQQLAVWFAEGNHAILQAKGNHPTAGCVVRLSRMHSIAECVDDLSDALLAALRSATTTLDRKVVVQRIKDAIILAQQYDTGDGFELETPDQMTDLYSLATALLKFDFRPHPVHPACRALQDALKGIKVYGDAGQPWVADGTDVSWNFTATQLAMNIFLPDPVLLGFWDWRSPYYLEVNPDPNRPPVQPNIIEFVKVTDWVDFLIEYHRDSPLDGSYVRLLPAAIPEFPVFNAGFKPSKPTPNDPGRLPHQPYTPPPALRIGGTAR